MTEVKVINGRLVVNKSTTTKGNGKAKNTHILSQSMTSCSSSQSRLILILALPQYPKQKPSIALPGQ